MSLTILPSGGSSHSGHSPQAAPILGIDLGTTFSLAAYLTSDKPELIRDDNGDGRVPSVLGFDDQGGVTIGFAARHRALADPEHTVYSIKRLIGRTLEDLQADLKYVPYQVVERTMVSGRKVLHVRLGEREHTPEELSALILKELVARAEAKLGQKVEKAVITVPAYFDESQRQATRDAGRLAGLDVVRIVNEPTAAALAYGLHQRQEGQIAVYDFGGGTFDCSILQLQAGVFKVLSTHGDTHLGGDDIDQALTKLIETELPASVRPVDAQLRQALREAAESAKQALTTEESTVLKVHLPERHLAFERPLTRAQLNEVMGPLVERTMRCCRAALRDAQLTPEQIEEVVLVGGSSRIPLVRQQVEELFGRKPHTELNPDEVVALGAAVQAGILSGRLRQFLLLDITPLSLGIETMGGAVSRLIARNSTVPCQATERFTTFVDHQTGVDIHIVQGERELAADCRSLGRFKLSGVPPMAAGMPQIDVTFLLDANGLLQVTARELRSDVEASIEVQPSHGLTREEVETMIRESIVRGREDFAARRLIELRNKAETNLRASEKALGQAGARLAPEQRVLIDTSERELRTAMAAQNPDALQKALDAFDAATLPLAELVMNTALSAKVVTKKLQDV